MPVFWQKLTAEARLECVSKIDSFHAEAAPGTTVWTKENVKKLRIYCDLDHIAMVRACYLVAKKDGSVFVGTFSEDATTTTAEIMTQTTIDSHGLFTKWDAAPLLTEYQKDKTCKLRQAKFFNHITNLAARKHSQQQTNTLLAPSPHYDVAMTVDQKQLLNPSWKDVVMGQIISESVGKCAIKKLAKRRIDAINGNINSYTKVCCRVSCLIRVISLFANDLFIFDLLF
jgi:hypothetical protein